MNEIQVERNHYKFNKYVNKRRWLSMWHQVDEVLSINPETALELGPGPGVFKAIISNYGINISTVDIDPDLKPDYIASATDLPFGNNSFDCTCAFQMLEHLPYEKSLKAFGEMTRVSKSYIIISLPDAKTLWPYTFHIPTIGPKTFHLPVPRIGLKKHKFDGQHFWEINKKGFPLKKIISDFCRFGTILQKTYRVPERPFHRFFIFKKS